MPCHHLLCDADWLSCVLSSVRHDCRPDKHMGAIVDNPLAVEAFEAAR